MVQIEGSRSPIESRIRDKLGLLKKLYVKKLPLEELFEAKPWLNKYLMNIKKRRWITLYALYKCCATNCIFSTNDEHAMVNHLSEHVVLLEVLKNSNPQEPNIEESDQSYETLHGWSNCSYCNYQNESPKKLVKHVKRFHGRCPFQCSHCFFRAADITYFDDHFKIYHPIRKRKVLICNVSIRSNKNFESKMLDGRTKNVIPFKCGKGKIKTGGHFIEGN